MAVREVPTDSIELGNMTFNAFTSLHQTKEAQIIAAHIDGISVDECYMFGDIMDFLWDNPDYVAAQRGTAGRPNILIESGVKNVAERWFRGRQSIVSLAEPKTIPDPAVGAVLAVTKHMNPEALKIAEGLHYNSMAAENIIGILLEKYIASQMEHYGWTWCAGEIVKSVDFLKKTDEGFIPLQIKNRSNSENSSSAAIRNGTDIIKWHRINAYNGITYWDKFPEPELVGTLTEDGFLDYIKESLA